MIAIKKILCSLPALVAAIGPLSAQLYHPGERLEYLTWTLTHRFYGSDRMLVLITYDVNTEDVAGRKRLRQICETVCQLRPAGAELCL